MQHLKFKIEKRGYGKEYSKKAGSLANKMKWLVTSSVNGDSFWLDTKAEAIEAVEKLARKPKYQ